VVHRLKQKEETMDDQTLAQAFSTMLELWPRGTFCTKDLFALINDPADPQATILRALIFPGITPRCWVSWQQTRSWLRKHSDKEVQIDEDKLILRRYGDPGQSSSYTVSSSESAFEICGA
jgi:hypothetical protein